MGCFWNMTNKLIAYHLERLKSNRPDVRLDAIRELRLLGDPSVLNVLEQVFKSDPEADVRTAAKEAGKEIFFKNRKPENPDPAKS
jgi:HEAT repeat protein